MLDWKACFNVKVNIWWLLLLIVWNLICGHDALEGKIQFKQTRNMRECVYYFRANYYHIPSYMPKQGYDNISVRVHLKKWDKSVNT